MRFGTQEVTLIVDDREVQCSLFAYQVKIPVSSYAGCYEIYTSNCIVCNAVLVATVCKLILMEGTTLASRQITI